MSVPPPDEDLVTIDLDFNGKTLPFRFPNAGNMASQLASVLSGQDYPLPPRPKGYAITTVVDIGANVGGAALRFLVTAPDARLVCFEPSAQNLACLSHNLQRFPNAEIQPWGLHAREMDVSLHLGADQCMQHSIVPSHETGSAVESIRLRRASTEFDRLGVSAISILKIDTEGCEVPILEDLGDRLLAVDMIFLEWHSDEDRRRIDGILAGHFLLTHIHGRHPHRGNACYLSRSLARGVPEVEAMRIG